MNDTNDTAPMMLYGLLGNSLVDWAALAGDLPKHGAVLHMLAWLH